MASTPFEIGITSGLKTLKEAIAYRWSDQARKDDMDKLKNIWDEGLAAVWKNTEHQKAKGTVMVLNTIMIGSLLLEACATARDVIIPKAPVGGGDTGPRSADTNIAPIKPTMVDGSFSGADEIKKSCEQVLKKECDVFGILYTNEKGEAKVSPFANDKQNNYFVWLGGDKFDPLTEKMDGDKVKWVNATNDVYFVGVPQEYSNTELKTLYYVDRDGKAWEISEPRAFHRAAVVKSTPTPTDTATATATKTSTSTLAPTRTYIAPSSTPLPTEIKSTVVVKPATIPATSTKEVQTGVPFESNGIKGLRSTAPIPGKEPRFPNNYRAMDCTVNPACDNAGIQFGTLQSAEAYWKSKYPNAVLRYDYWLFDDGGVSKVFVGLVSTGK